MPSEPPKWLANWLERHQHPASRWLHYVGIPLAVGGLVLGGVQLVWALGDPSQWALWWRPVGLIVLGYLLQWIGHRIEGNDVGEFILIKKWLGLPYVAVSPRYAAAADRPEGDSARSRASE